MTARYIRVCWAMAQALILAETAREIADTMIPYGLLAAAVFAAVTVAHMRRVDRHGLTPTSPDPSGESATGKGGVVAPPSVRTSTASD